MKLEAEHADEGAYRILHGPSIRQGHLPEVHSLHQLKAGLCARLCADVLHLRTAAEAGVNSRTSYANSRCSALPLPCTLLSCNARGVPTSKSGAGLCLSGTTAGKSATSQLFTAESYQEIAFAVKSQAAQQQGSVAPIAPEAL